MDMVTRTVPGENHKTVRYRCFELTAKGETVVFLYASVRTKQDPALELGSGIPEQLVPLRLAELRMAQDVTRRQMGPSTGAQGLCRQTSGPGCPDAHGAAPDAPLTRPQVAERLPLIPQWVRTLEGRSNPTLRSVADYLEVLGDAANLNVQVQLKRVAVFDNVEVELT